MIKTDFNVIRTADPRVSQILAIAENIASSKATVLLQGESGTGKELMARFIHARSSRASNVFYAVNCAALPEGLLESELFGHEKGAFTGAVERKIGKFELADRSTFLLDEISEMPLPLQAKLLRVLQEGEVERLGGRQPIKINVRSIATTNRDLREMVREGGFREDLYYRLNVIPLKIPALRYRPKDIEQLSQHFVDQSCVENGLPSKRLTVEAMQTLLEYPWPGNVRELKNSIERSVLLCQGLSLRPQDLLLNDLGEYGNLTLDQLKPGMTVAEAEKRLIIKTLEHTKQNRTHAARMLGISIRTLRNKINEYKEDQVTL